MTPRRDWAGHRFGHLVAQRSYKLSKSGRGAPWECLCDCGQTAEVYSADLVRGHTISCGCAIGVANRERARVPREAVLRRLFSGYQSNAVRKNREFLLHLDEFRLLIAGNCFYCGIEPCSISTLDRNRVIAYFYNGVDRADNAKGYTTENCVSCCAVCNRMKRDLTQEEFLHHVKRIQKMHESCL
jgi:5-methylcytosine-specific restriction endonuclease McrA